MVDKDSKLWTIRIEDLMQVEEDIKKLEHLREKLSKIVLLYF
jgi:hypothetical protein